MNLLLIIKIELNMKKDFVEIANDSGTNNGSFDVVCEQNSGNERSTILTVSGGGVNKAINITQKASSLESIELQVVYILLMEL